MGNSGLPPAKSMAERLLQGSHRDLQLFALYRILVAVLITALVLPPFSILLGEPRYPLLASTVALSYLLLSLLLLLSGYWQRWLTAITVIGLTFDIAAATLAIHIYPNANAGIAMMLLFNIAVAATLLPLRHGLCIALTAAAATALEYLWTQIDGSPRHSTFAELVMFASSYLALTCVCHHLGQRARYNQLLADKRDATIANLAEISELIIRRMRTGVVVVDGNNQISLANEAAIALLGDADNAGPLALNRTPELLRRLLLWRSGRIQEQTPLQLSPDRPEVQPRFARLLANSDLTLIFLDDASVISRRAESLTLSAMGRFSASLAHEIRNPLTAISYAAQLLEESTDSTQTEQRLLQIIHLQCQRANSIVESVLSLARRERANPENIALAGFVERFALEYQQSMPLESDKLETSIERPAAALMDPQHLQQILTALVHNAFKYGRNPGQHADVQLRVTLRERNAIIEVIDHGHGIPESALTHLFTPFFTTSEHGTGLGLYIARELCRVNQAQLEYHASPTGGACFRVKLPTPHSLLPA
jgi:two-component system sensor histidine kinase PilS (NtrC family)